MLHFLNDEYVRSLKALYFINSSSEPVTVEEIAIQIGSGRKTVATLLSILKMDIVNCNFELQETLDKKYYLTSKEKQTIYLDDYLLICGKRSLLFLMVEELFNKGFIHTIQFCNNLYISQTTFSRGKKKLIELLEKSQLTLTNYVRDGIYGDEYQVRIFYFHFFDHFYNSLEWPFEQNQKMDEECTIKLEQIKLFDQMTSNQKRKLSNVLAIMKKRVNQGYVVKSLSVSFENNAYYEKIYSFVGSYLNVHGRLDRQAIQNETDFFIRVLFTQDIINLRADYLTYLLEYSKDNPLNVEIASIWIQTFKTVFKQGMTIEEELIWHQELCKFHSSNEFLYSDPTLFLNNLAGQDESSFNHEIYQQTVEFYQLLLKNKVFQEFKKKNLKNVTDEFMIDRYYFYLYYYFLKLKKPKPVLVYISDSISWIDQSILTKKLELLFGEQIKIVGNSYESETLFLANLDHKNLECEAVVIISCQDEQNFKKLVQRIHEKIHEQLVH